VRPVHVGEGERGEREFAGDEGCPCGGGRAWREGSLLAVRPDVPSPPTPLPITGEGGLLAMRPVPCGGG